MEIATASMALVKGVAKAIVPEDVGLDFAKANVR
jgi:hypothetical protein